MEKTHFSEGLSQITWAVISIPQIISHRDEQERPIYHCRHFMKVFDRAIFVHQNDHEIFCTHNTEISIC
jgi:hypothetical protein